MACATAAFGLAVPAGAFAEAVPAAYVKDSNTQEKTYYSKIDDAVQAAYAKDKILVMTSDWETGAEGFWSNSALEIEEGKAITIDMNGHMMWNASTCATIVLEKGSKLTLTSTTQKDLKYEGYSSNDKSKGTYTVHSGGLITNVQVTSYTNYHSCIEVGEEATLDLDGVAVAGGAGADPTTDSSKVGGGITLAQRSTLNMTNGAVIEHCKSGKAGGGVLATGNSGVTINMNASYIRNNYADTLGGGIEIHGCEGSTINMQNGSKVEGNSATAGGGIYVHAWNFTITSSDGDAHVLNNTARNSNAASQAENQSGGGIHTYGVGGTIENINIEGNHSRYDGGGMELDAKNVTIKNCTIKNNTSDRDGGGVFVYHSGNAFENCTITGNACALDGDYEGGGIFVGYYYDIKMTGLCIVKGNTRGKDSDNADDVFLSNNIGNTARAYITGGVSQGSTVGVRTKSTSDQRIGDKIKNASTDCFFADLDGYYVSYGDDHDGDMWQRHATKSFDVKINGATAGRYQYGSSVTVNGGADSSKAFKCWTAKGTTGLYPFSDYVSDENLASPVFTFEMPQNDVNLAAEYVDRRDALTLSVNAPQPGTSLPATGTLTWDDGAGTWENVRVSWLVLEDGEWAAASGVAECGASYRVEISVTEASALEHGLAFARTIDAAKQTVLIGGKTYGAKTAAVDAAGRLSLTSNTYETAKPAVTSVEPASITVKEGSAEDELRKLLPSKALAETDAGTTVSLDVVTEGLDLGTLISNGAVVRPESGSATLQIPVKSGDGEVTVPANSTVKVTVTVVEKDSETETVEAPPLAPAEGTYSKTKNPENFTGGRFRVTAENAPSDVTLRWNIVQRDAKDDEWEASVTDGVARAIQLPINKGGHRYFKVDVCAVKNGVESEHVVREYDVDDTSEVEKHKITVVYTDTADEAHHGSKKNDTHNVDAGSDISIVAPDRPGYAFEKWIVSTDDVRTDATLTLENIGADTTVTAVYNPVVSELDLSVEAPVAHEKLADSGSIKAKFGDLENAIDVTGYFAGKNGAASVSWSPEGGSDGAEHDTRYTASLSLKAGASKGDVKYVISPTASVTYKGNPVPGSAYVAGKNDDARLCVEFAGTGPREYQSTDALDPIELSYEKAWKAQAAQNADGDLTGWNLPDTVTVYYACKESEPYAITWSSVEALNGKTTEAQKLKATGTITFPDTVEHDGETETVSVTIKVAAPKTVTVPECSLKSGTYKGTQKAEISCKTEDAIIRYTVDGSIPNESSAAYTGAIEISKTAIVKARAFREGWTASDTAAFSYTIEPENSDQDEKDNENDKDNEKNDSDKDAGEDTTDKGSDENVNRTNDALESEKNRTEAVVKTTFTTTSNDSDLAATGDDTSALRLGIASFGLLLAAIGTATLCHGKRS